MTDPAYRFPEPDRKHLDALAHDVCGARLNGYAVDVLCVRSAGHKGRHANDYVSWPAE